MRNRSMLIAGAALCASAGYIAAFDAKSPKTDGGGSPEFAASPKIVSEIVAATKTNSDYAMPIADATAYANAGILEMHPNGPDATGNVLVRATDATIKDSDESTDADTAAAGKPSYAVERMAFPSDLSATRRTRESTYPFATLGEPKFADDGVTIVDADSFHIPATTEKPNPERSYASTVSSAQARFDVEVKDANGNVVKENVTVRVRRKDAEGNAIKNAEGKYEYDEVTESRAKTEPTRLFKITAAAPNDPKGKGARVWRVK